jgi:hypothetical protein
MARTPDTHEYYALIAGVMQATPRTGNGRGLQVSDQILKRHPLRGSPASSTGIFRR